MLGTLLNGRFRLLRVLGSGGFGQTFVAEDTLHPSCARCVVKQFKPATQDAHFLQEGRRLFFSEAKTLEKLGSHDQIPTLIADFEENQEFYLVQEYVEGQPLNDELASVHQLSEADVVALLKDVLHILEFVHRNQVIHRDIKPGNLIRRQRDGRFVLIDFGAVKEIQTQLITASGQTNLTIGIGTYGYSPSEQLMGKPRYNSDLYALGMTAIQALTGFQPAQLPTHAETGEVIWRDQVEVSSGLAAILDQLVRYHFSQRFQSATEVLWAIDHPEQTVAHTTVDTPLSDETRLPDERSTQPLAKPVTRPIKRIMRAGRAIVVAGAAVTSVLLGVRELGWFQPLELAVFDRLVQLSPDPGPDPRLLVVGITDADIQAQQRFPLSDRVIAQTIKTLKRYQPKAIGLDLLRDVPQEPGRSELLTELKTPNLIAIMNSSSIGKSSLPGVPVDRIGFNDLVLDDDGVVRRNLMFGDQEGGPRLDSLSVKLATTYLANTQSVPVEQLNETTLRIGKAVFQPLGSTAGSYQGVDDGGYQILLRYRGRTPARLVSLGNVLKGQVKPEWVKDKIVVIGTTAESAKDLFFTPYSAIDNANTKMPGVIIHAQMVSQLLSAMLDGDSLIWYWPDWGERVWISMWALLGGALAWQVRRPLLLGISGSLLLLLVAAAGVGVFARQGWIPIAAPAIAATLTGGTVVAYRAYWHQ